MRDFADLYRLQPSQLENLVVTPREPRSERAVPRKLGKVGRNVAEQIEQLQAERPVAAGLRRWASATSARRRRPRSRGYLRTMTAILEASVEQLQTVPDIGPVVAASVRASRTSRRTAR